MEISTCLECGSRIGGLSHQLDSQKRSMDGIFAEAISSAHR